MKSLYFFLLSVSLTLIISATIISTTSGQVINGTYAIKNIQTGMLLRIKDANKSNGTPLVAYSPVNWKCVTWDFKHVSGQTYQLKNLFTSKTFQHSQLSPAEGAALEQQPLTLNQVNQQYEFIAVEKSIYFIRLRDTDLYITHSTGNGASESTIILAKKNGSKLQHWAIYQQSPEI